MQIHVGNMWFIILYITNQYIQWKPSESHIWTHVDTETFDEYSQERMRSHTETATGQNNESTG